MLQQKTFNMRESGFSLVELMVGLVIGLFATLVIMQVFSVFEGQKRTTSGTADAQTNGMIALMQVQRHLQTAGYGMPMPMADPINNILRCTSVAATNAFPVVIVDGVNGNGGDRVISRYSTTAAGAVPINIINASNATVGDGMTVDNNIGCGSDLEMAQLRYNGTYQDLTDTTAEAASQPANTVMVISNNQCAVAEIAKQPTNTAGVSSIRLVAVPADMPPVGPAVTPRPKLACMGGYGDHTLDVNALTNELLLNNSPVISEVVSIQAQYGVSASPGSNAVTSWEDAVGPWAAPTVNDRNRIKAVRVAIVLRNGLKEKDPVTPNAARPWRDAEGTVLMNLSVAHLPDWDKYRYRVFGTVVPLRNMIWSREAIQ